MSETVEVLAKAILQELGGADNVKHMECCMTRVRIQVNDESRVAPMERLKDLEALKGYQAHGQEFQFVFGPGLCEAVLSELRQQVRAVVAPSEGLPHAQAGGSEDAFRDSPIKSQSPKHTCNRESLRQALATISRIFSPLIPAFIASGLLSGVANTILRFGFDGSAVPSASEGALPLLSSLGFMRYLSVLGGSVFEILHILIGIRAAQVLGGSMALGGVISHILYSGGLAGLSLYAGQPLQPGRGGVFSVLMVIWLMCVIERKIRARLAGAWQLLLTPMITLFVTASMALYIIQPIGGILASLIVSLVEFALKFGGLVAGAVLAGSFLPWVLAGLHQGFVPIHQGLIDAHGHNALLPIFAMAGMGQVGASLAVWYRTCNRRLLEVIPSALPAGLLGIGEPLPYGVTVPLGRPFVGACLGAAVGGALVSYFKLATLITFGISGLPLGLTMVGDGLPKYFLCAAVAIVSGFLFTMAIGFEKAGREDSDAPVGKAAGTPSLVGGADQA